MIAHTIGIDISKDQLDAYRCGDGECRRFANTRAGYQDLIAWLGQTPFTVVAFEATGPYHRAFEEAMDDAQIPVAKMNPWQVRRFAQASGVLAKTDQVDAQLLARMAACLDIEPKAANSKTLNNLRELRTARANLSKERTATINRAKTLTITLLKRQNRQRLAQIEAQIKAVEAEILEFFAADPSLTRRHSILKSIPGISDVTASAMLIEMPELGCLEAKQAASLAGLAPMTQQSGRWRGKARIRGGRRRLRQALYMPTLVAARFNPDLKAKYQALITAGKPPKVALTALMRKLIVLANALLRDDREWTPNIA